MAMRGGLENKPRRVPPDFGLAQVNIVLLLVLFFLVTGTLVESEEQSVNLPETEDLPFERLPRPLLLVGAEGDWSLDGASVTPDTLLEELVRVTADLGPDAPVNLLAARSVPADVILAAMSALAPSERPVMLVTITNAGTNARQNR